MRNNGDQGVRQGLGGRRRARPVRPQLSQATRTALFVYASAADAGFSFRAGAGRLEVEGPPGLPDAVCQPIVKAVREHGAEILRLLRWFDREAAHGRFWSPPRGPEMRQ
jgi:hypothetical protein